MLIFPLKKEWYEKIKSGEKTIEYREVKPYWVKRLQKEWGLNYDSYVPKIKRLIFTSECLGTAYNCNDKPIPCKLRLGYTNQYMTANITKIKIIDGKDTDLHIDKPVYAIHLANVREEKNDGRTERKIRKLPE